MPSPDEEVLCSLCFLRAMVSMIRRRTRCDRRKFGKVGILPDPASSQLEEGGQEVEWNGWV